MPNHSLNIANFFLCRSLFVATVILFAYQAEPAWLFQSDAGRIINLVLFAFTQGICSLVLIHVPMSCSETNRAKGGELGGMSLLFGILIGCLFSSFLFNNLFY